MASLTEVYEGGNGASLRRLYAGVALFGVGAVLVTTGLVLASTGVRSYFGLGLYDARKLAGIFGGIGIPAVLVGTVAALPRASTMLRTASGVGAAVCLAAVGMFVRWYPVDWVGASGNQTMTFVVAGTYFFGAILLTWSLFTAVANFKARNDPGGTVTLEVTEGGETTVVEVSNDNLEQRLSGIGMLGGTPDGDVETQTNADEESTSEPERRASRSEQSVSTGGSKRRSKGGSIGPTGASAGVTDGGATTDDIEFLGEDVSAADTDTYCGNCRHFRYARTDDGMVPYCGFHGEAMDDMDACDHWTASN
jgi:hypothetical protein